MARASAPDAPAAVKHSVAVTLKARAVETEVETVHKHMEWLLGPLGE